MGDYGGGGAVEWSGVADLRLFNMCWAWRFGGGWVGGVISIWVILVYSWLL